MKKILSIIILLYIAASYIVPAIGNCGVDKISVRYPIDTEHIYLDDEALAAADSYGDTGLASEAIIACNIINEYREDNGLETLDWDVNLQSVSDVRAKEASRNFSHTRPDGSNWNTVNSQIQGGENLAFGFNSADAVVDAWMDSPSHRDNILYDDFTKVAISIYEDSCGVLYWAQEFNY